jgi:hypothetical protein
MSSVRPKTVLLILATGAWLAAVGWGMLRLFEYSFTAAPAGAAAARWPESGKLLPATDGSTLVIALQPDCPCSQVSVEELDGILAGASAPVKVIALFVSYKTLPQPVEETPMWRRVSALPHATAVPDPDATEARRFGMAASGEVRLYQADGTLRFHGGITLSRDRAGANPGQAAVAAIVNRRATWRETLSAPNYGCAF